jgi:predicted HTH transcriptional regulator
MYELPTFMKIRFWFYLNFMPITEEVIMYLLFTSGIALLIWSIIRILSSPTKKSSSELLEMGKKRQKMQTDKQIESKEKEMDVYNTLLASDNPDLTFIV